MPRIASRARRTVPGTRTQTPSDSSNAATRRAKSDPRPTVDTCGPVSDSAMPAVAARISHALISGPPTLKFNRKYVGAGT